MRVATAHLALLAYLLGGLVVPALHDCADHQASGQQGAGQQGAGQHAGEVDQRAPRSCAGHHNPTVSFKRTPGGDQRSEWCSGHTPHSDLAHPCLACLFNTFDELATVSSPQQVIAQKLSALIPLAVSRLTPGPSTLSISPRGPPAHRRLV